MAKLPPTPSLKEIARDDFGRFIAYDNGTVKDTRTGLMWAAKDNGRSVTRQEAKEYCKNYRGGGYTDWRMPTQNELAGLYDKNKSYRTKNEFWSDTVVHLTELIQLISQAAWASETRGSEVAYFGFGEVAERGWISLSDVPDVHSYALPVRHGN